MVLHTMVKTKGPVQISERSSFPSSPGTQAGMAQAPLQNLSLQSQNRDIFLLFTIKTTNSNHRPTLYGLSRLMTNGLGDSDMSVEIELPRLKPLSRG